MQRSGWCLITQDCHLASAHSSEQHHSYSSITPVFSLKFIFSFQPCYWNINVCTKKKKNQFLHGKPLILTLKAF